MSNGLREEGKNDGREGKCFRTLNFFLLFVKMASFIAPLLADDSVELISLIGMISYGEIIKREAGRQRKEVRSHV